MINVTSPVHPYVQIADQLRDSIQSGETSLATGGRTPLAAGLATGVAPGTVRRAFAILKAEGLIYAVPGRGTFVRREDAR